MGTDFGDLDVICGSANIVFPSRSVSSTAVRKLEEHTKKGIFLVGAEEVWSTWQIQRAETRAVMSIRSNTEVLVPRQLRRGDELRREQFLLFP